MTMPSNDTLFHNRSLKVRSTPRRSLEIRATLKILGEAKVFIICSSTLILEELIREVLGRLNSSHFRTPEQNTIPKYGYKTKIASKDCYKT
ncbi:hypothetical protein PIB30_005680 [Stylosanthes scabra]|uniref:Uncharacterized protein n=1 Tax=Stylosanthes scabra TaxID=79078 RepID=A0ABU6U2U1_9FABA|nr:hypothetical protein [Stylosanthes scabra]